MRIILDRLDDIEQNVREISNIGSAASMIATPSARSRSPYIVGENKTTPFSFNEMTSMMMGTGKKGNVMDTHISCF